ncbi:acyl-CoA dehydrogenase family protein [Nonomuraea sp. NPDC050536]|uniref:acyl-CoA dehydrogenase family protein n=1 Tax=Nonomuraea sp. NPDC050536 TaxID=3364366 RepID=UPI0037C7E656
MDFNLDETQRDLRDLAADVLAKEASQERLEAHERGGAPYDEKLWQALDQAGLLSLCLPERAGGAGLGPVEMAVVLREVGARAAPGPMLARLVSTLAVARYGTAEQQNRVASATISTVATGAETVAQRWQGVPYAEQAEVILLAADDGLYLAPGPVAAIAEFTSTGEPAATITVEGERMAGAEAAAETRRLYTAAVAAQAGGVLAGALKLTTEYIRTRNQFGRALAEFQAVTMQIADVYIAGRALDVAMWSGAWRLAEGLPAEEDLAIAAFHVSEAFKALYTCQHLHGGLGLDVTYPLHRYFAHAKHLTHLLGGADAQLDRIGALA